MEKAVTYYNFAENDYLFLKANVEENRISNAMCSSAQNICERYLKEIIQNKANELDNTEIMKTHSIKKLRKFIDEYLPDFQCDWKTVVQVDGYYFSARYPGEDSYFVNETDVKLCWEAVTETKRCVDNYLSLNQEKSQKVPFEHMEAHVSKLNRKLGR